MVKIVIFGQNCTACIVKRSTERLSVDSARLSVEGQPQGGRRKPEWHADLVPGPLDLEG